ncbi:hypothetical protein [Endozoicomonas arenosclerae]|uniref:hypothetical protein n=1 Tax=Endozoicomonas arenosclerae TaxID=1633495 RepID=UPI0007851A44|nr:hypothetical protein [Endozoicomonas arenosclerae]
MESRSQAVQNQPLPGCLVKQDQPRIKKAGPLTFASRTLKTIPSHLTTPQLIDSLSKVDASVRSRFIQSSNPYDFSHALDAEFPDIEEKMKTSSVDSLEVIEALNNKCLVEAYHRYVDEGEEDAAPVLREAMNRAASLHFLRTMDQQSLYEFTEDELQMKQAIERSFYQYLGACETIQQDIPSENALNYIQVQSVKSQVREWLFEVHYCPVRCRTVQQLERELDIPDEQDSDFNVEAFFEQRMGELESAVELLVLLFWAEKSEVKPAFLDQCRGKIARLLCSDLLAKVYLGEYFDALGAECSRFADRKDVGSFSYQCGLKTLVDKIWPLLIKAVENARKTAEKVPYKKDSFSSLESCCYYLKVFYQKPIVVFLRELLEKHVTDEQLVRQVSSDYEPVDIRCRVALEEAEKRKDQYDTGLNLSSKFSLLSKETKADWLKKVNEAWEKNERPPWPEQEEEKQTPVGDDDDDDLYD